MKVLVTGGSGFIGSAYIRWLLDETDVEVVNLDALTYAAVPGALDMVRNESRYVFEHADVTDRDALVRVFGRHQPDAVVHLAAESHVDRSIDGPSVFVRTNVEGTATLLNVCLTYWRDLDPARRERFRVHHVSTDEVYGALGPEGRFREDSPYAPNSPYAATKASADHLVRAWHRTYGLPAVITNCSNNYGPFQFPEKLIPLATIRAVEGESIPVYGTGENIRDWLHVDDHCAALWAVLNRGEPGRVYLVGGDGERRNIEVVRSICDILDVKRPRPDGRSRRDQITFVTDRPGHDARYAIDASRICQELGWRPERPFETGLAETVEWYLTNPGWWRPIRDRSYRGERLGLRSVT